MKNEVNLISQEKTGSYAQVRLVGAFIGWLFICLSSIGPISASPQSPPLLTVHCIPFNAETIVSVTPSSIQNVTPNFVSSPAITTEISDCLASEGGSGQFHPGSTRLLVVFPSGCHILADQWGIVLADGHSHALIPSKLRRLKVLLDGMLEDRRKATELAEEAAKPALIRALDRGDDAEAQRLLSSGVDPNLRGKDAMTPLMDAAFHGNVVLCAALIGHGADIDAEDRDYDNALGYAVIGEQLNAFRWLLARGIAVRGRSGAKALQYAVVIENIAVKKAMVTSLLVNHAPVETPWLKHDMTTLMWVIGDRNPALVHELIRRGADVNATDGSGRTPLIWAAITGDDPALKLLVAHGAMINQREGDITALTMAVRNQHLSSVRLLLRWGATWNRQTLVDAQANRNGAILRLLQSSRVRRHQR